MRKWEHLLRFRPFVWRTDCESYRHQRGLVDPQGRWLRIREEMSSFQFEVVHRPGVKHSNVDTVSRAEHLDEATPEDELDASQYVHQLEPVPSLVSRSTSSDDDPTPCPHCLQLLNPVKSTPATPTTYPTTTMWKHRLTCPYR